MIGIGSLPALSVRLEWLRRRPSWRSIDGISHYDYDYDVVAQDLPSPLYAAGRRTQRDEAEGKSVVVLFSNATSGNPQES